MSWKTNSSFDPFNQDFIILAPDGRTQIPIPLAFVHKVQVNTVQKGIAQGSQIGAAALLLICLILVTRTDKRRSLVFILNALALLLVVIRGIFTAIGLTGPFYDWYQYETGYYVHVERAQAVSVCAELGSFLLVVVLELSLILQVRIVCCTLEPCWRHLVNILNVFVALLVSGGRLGLAVLDIHWNILGFQHETDWQFNRISRLASATDILFVVGIGVSASIFCAKLAYAIHRRRSMGMTQFGAMQVIFIMGCQTMIAPFIFTIITYFGVKDAQMQIFGPTVVALCLPLSAMWAAANTNNVHIADPDPQHRRVIPIGQKDLASGKAYGGTSTTTSDTPIDDDSTIATSPTKGTGFNKTSQSDLEMQKLEDGVQGGRTDNVRSEQESGSSHNPQSSRTKDYTVQWDAVELSANRNSSLVG